ncbi:hypothetical protein HZ992_14730 [Rhizobacter sp. AJA081-3]|uniref:hypothetical protein n=1 Tax=Rhizobacter sp. AJA081-3 TaxID=2753607 RepID=UPI001ADED6A2|nr:hypothetical protein [Rhizobacter sp. AJA081-3]QTN21439.1 hypothetical protein HZ992_14730 [Rhizobacter sp. AJA081-3]
MQQPAFSHEQALPSLKVNKDLLEALEKYLVKRFSDALQTSEEEIRKRYSLQIEDSLGTEKLASVEQMSATKFADSTSQVEVELDSPYREDGQRMRVRVRFSKGRLFSTLAVSAAAPNARELVLGVRDGLLRVLEPHKTWNSLAHPSSAGWGIGIGLGGWMMYGLFAADAKSTYFPFLLAAFTLLWLYLFAFGPLRPYSTFESRASERNEKIWSWLIAGLGTFLLFGTLLTLYRRSVLGF